QHALRTAPLLPVGNQVTHRPTPLWATRPHGRSWVVRLKPRSPERELEFKRARPRGFSTAGTEPVLPLSPTGPRRGNFSPSGRPPQELSWRAPLCDLGETGATRVQLLLFVPHFLQSFTDAVGCNRDSRRQVVDHRVNQHEGNRPT